MIEIEIGKLIGTHTAPVKVTRGGKTFYQQRRVGKKAVESNDEKYRVATEQVSSWVDENPDRADDVDNTLTYCKAGYEIINKTMRRIPDDVFDTFLPPDDIQSVSNFLRDAPSFDGMVYRGVNIDTKANFDAFMKGVEGGTIRMKSFTSTTVDQEKSKGYAYLYPRINPPVYMAIKSKRGVSVRNISASPRENEVLFDYGSKFKVINYNVSDKEVNIELEEI